MKTIMKTTALLSTIILAVLTGCGSTPETPASTLDFTKPIVTVEPQERLVLSYLNEARTRGTVDGQDVVNGSCVTQPFTPRPALNFDGEAHHAARMHAGYLSTTGVAEGAAAHFQDLRNGEFWGYSPQERLEHTMVRYGQGLGNYSQMAENIAAGDMSPAEAVRAWMESPAHCAAMMDPVYTGGAIADMPGRTGVSASGRATYPHNWVMVLIQR